MTRKEFLQLARSANPRPTLSSTSSTEALPEVAFTFDDPANDRADIQVPAEVSDFLLAALRRYHVKSALFVRGKFVDSSSGRRMLAEWDHEGHMIGNHSYSHFDCHQIQGDIFRELGRVTLAEITADIIKNESIIRNYRNFTRLFRFPFLKEGNTLENRDGIRAFLGCHGYRIARPTIDTSDWAIDARLEKSARQSHTMTNLDAFRLYFFNHVWDRAQFYEGLARRLKIPPLRHTLLLHYNVLNALFLGDLIAMFQAKGWKIVNAQYAYQDTIYDWQPEILPAGESLIWGLARQDGDLGKTLRYPGEDATYEDPKMDDFGLAFTPESVQKHI